MASGECALTCVSRARHRSRLVSTNSYIRESILSIIDGTMLLARQAERCFRILRHAHALVTCAYCLEARRTLDAMRRVRMRVFVALRARFERSDLAACRVRMAFTAVWSGMPGSDTV